MGQFSWLRADKNHKIANVLEGKQVKLLIPKQFGGGHLRGVYDGYGNIVSKNGDKYSINETLWIWNYPALQNEIFKNAYTELYRYFTYKGELDNLLQKPNLSFMDKFNIDYRKTAIAEIELKYDTLYKEYKVEAKKYTKTIVGKELELISEKTDNRENEIYYYSDLSFLLPFPLKLVSISYKGDYESCISYSPNDPYQGISPITWEEVDKNYNFPLITD